jgi:hypothetical protein
MKNKDEIKVVINIILLIFMAVIINSMIVLMIRSNFYKDLSKRNIWKNYEVRAKSFNKDLYNTLYIKEKNNIKKYNSVMTTMFYNNLYDNILTDFMIKKLGYLDYLKNNILDMKEYCKYFPIMYKKEDLDNKIDKFSYENSWSAPRKYGGNRLHEGCDLMYKENKSDEVPIVSICDGLIVKKGWLDLGGYRLYIRVKENMYIYYAHLSSYAKGLEEGDCVKAGEILGYMGSTGYGVEGTDNKFDVHLHLGVYVRDEHDKDIAINPYYLLRFLENYKLSYKSS